ncbi:site-specific integrase [uncultured Bacteroides sp.]|uniref:tyrosine-type recombinase/integrase n=1 Tax=uncultured Bacteroides sp. TaxID=162156 RepID=UPI002AA91BBB|nr:site-specific integrase [uncultured Bacteroides sp.]
MKTSFSDFTLNLCNELKLSGRDGTSAAYRSTLRSVERFRADNEISFEDFTPEWLKQYERYLTGLGRCRNTVSLYMRMLRSIYNQAVEKELAADNPRLFDQVFTGNDPSAKRAVTPAVIQQLCGADLESYPSLAMARDLFLLSFYLRGIPFVDLIHLRRSDLRNGVLSYRRTKTGGLVTVEVEPCAMTLIRRYASSNNRSPYLLSIVNGSGKNEYKQYQSALRSYNKRLVRLSLLLKLKTKLSSYVARHSWATAAYHAGIPVGVISESLGHSSEKITYTYLASFDNRTLRKANRRVIALIKPGNREEQSSAGYKNQWTKQLFNRME